MIYFEHLFFGIIMAYFGLIAPGMLNMTALKTRIHFGKSASIKFSLGAALIVFLQAGIALFFADFFVKNPRVIELLKFVAVGVFFLLALFFFLLSRRELKAKTTNTTRNYFLKGIAMSSLNMLSIPFYLGMSIYLASIGKIIIEQPYIMLFVYGAAMGSFLLFYTYIIFARIIMTKVSYIAKNINAILSLLFLLLGFLTLIKILK